MNVLPLFVLLLVSLNCILSKTVVNTWPFSAATVSAWTELEKSGSALEALVSGCSMCERLQCDGTVGFGGSPDENGETFLDAMIMDGTSKNAGAVGHLRNMRDAIRLAKYVMLYTEHTFLVGQRAFEFGLQMGFSEVPTETDESTARWQSWRNNHCQPNFWSPAGLLAPNPKESCGPYSPTELNDVNNRLRANRFEMSNENSHDTIGMIVVDADKNFIVGTSTNGASFKIPGRIGDSPIIGSGGYADSEVGAAAATGDGDVMMRFLPSFLAVEELRRGASVFEAAEAAMRRVGTAFPGFFGGIVVVDKDERVGAACNGMQRFPYSMANSTSGGVITLYVDCLKL